MKKLTVLLITDTYNPNGGGAEKHFFDLKKQLERSPQLSVYTFGFGPSSREDAHTKVIQETSSLFMRQFWRMFFNPVKYFQIRIFIKRVNPDVIHLHNVNKYTPSLLLAIKGYPVVQTVHDYSLVCPTLWNVHDDMRPCPSGMKWGCVRKHRRTYSWFVYPSMLFSFWQKKALLKRRVKTFLVPSFPSQKTMKAQGFDNVLFFPHYLFLKDKQPSFERMHPHQLLYVGQLEQNKGVHLLLEALPAVAAKVPDVALKIAGEGAYKQHLVERVKQLGLQRHVTFQGWVNDTDSLFQESAVLVVPSLIQECSPLVVAEAMAHSRPVLGSNRGGLPWLIRHGKTGLLFDPLKKGDLAEKLLLLLSDKKKAVAYGKEAHKNLSIYPDSKGYVQQLLARYPRLAA